MPIHFSGGCKQNWRRWNSGFDLCAHLMAASVHEDVQLACKICLWINLLATVQREEGKPDNEGREPCPTTLHLNLAFLPFLGHPLTLLSHTNFLRGGETKTNIAFFSTWWKSYPKGKLSELFFFVLLIFVRGLAIIFLLSLISGMYVSVTESEDKKMWASRKILCIVGLQSCFAKRVLIIHRLLQGS